MDEEKILTLDDLKYPKKFKESLEKHRLMINEQLASSLRYRGRHPSPNTIRGWAKNGVAPRQAKKRGWTPKKRENPDEETIRKREESKKAYRYPYRWARLTWRRIKRKCSISGMEFNIDISDIYPPEECPVFGFKLEIGGTTYKETFNNPSVDRFDNSLGYIKGNVRVISKRANSLKSDSTVEELEMVVKYMKS